MGDRLRLVMDMIFLSSNDPKVKFSYGKIRKRGCYQGSYLKCYMPNEKNFLHARRVFKVIATAKISAPKSAIMDRRGRELHKKHCEIIKKRNNSTSYRV